MKHKPNYIYKYSSISAFTFKNLILGQLRFNPPTLMNDQLEGMIKVKNTEFRPSKKAINNFLADKQLDYWWNERDIDEKGFLEFYMDYWFNYELKKYRITCFSRTATETLMWAHYADKHSGICLIYEKDILIKSLKSIDNFELLPVQYGVKPTITLLEKDNRIDYDSDIPIISAKDPNWKYEKEVRIYNVHEETDRIYGDSFYTPREALIGVIYGHKISENDKDAISMIFRNEPLYGHVVEYDEVIDYQLGKIVIQ